MNAVVLFVMSSALGIRSCWGRKRLKLYPVFSSEFHLHNLVVQFELSLGQPLLLTKPELRNSTDNEVFSQKQARRYSHV